MTTARAWLMTGDRWIPGLFVAGFAVVVAANAALIWVAIGSFSGLATADYYDRGRKYNETLATARELAETGWSATVAAAPQGDGRYLLEVAVAAADGAPLSGAEVMARFVRPADPDADFETMLQPAGDGLWRAEVTPGVAGLWQVRLFVSRDDEVFAVEHRLVLQP
jgi:nitrogen fixation protein FixH